MSVIGVEGRLRDRETGKPRHNNTTNEYARELPKTVASLQHVGVSSFSFELAFLSPWLLTLGSKYESNQSFHSSSR